MSIKDLNTKEGKKKIRVVLELEFDNEPYVELCDPKKIAKTDEEILKALTIDASEEIDGFEIFPRFTDVDISSVFYLTDATIVEKKILPPALTKEKIQELIDNNLIVVLYADDRSIYAGNAKECKTFDKYSSFISHWRNLVNEKENSNKYYSVFFMGENICTGLIDASDINLFNGAVRDFCVK